MERQENSSSLDVRDFIEFLVKKFFFERIIYSVATILSVIGLFVCIFSIILSDNSKTAYIIGLAGPTGVISYSCAKILEMWKDSVMLVAKYIDKMTSHE